MASLWIRIEEMEMSVFKLSAAVFVASLLAAVPALAVEDGQFTWTGYGRDGPPPD